MDGGVVAVNVSFGVNAGIFPGSFSVEDKIRATGETGYPLIELNVEANALLPRLLDERAKQNILETCKNNGVSIASVCMNAHWVFNLSSSDVRIRDVGVDLLLESINLASELRFETILVPCCYLGEIPLKDAIRLFQTNLGKALAEAESKGIVLALELVSRGLYKSYSEIMQVIRYFRSPALAAYLDIGNISRLGLDPVSEVNSVAGSIRQVHIKDTGTTFFGRGRVDFEQFVQLLREVGYEGPVIVELGPDPTDPLKMARDSLVVLERMFASQGEVKS